MQIKPIHIFKLTLILTLIFKIQFHDLPYYMYSIYFPNGGDGLEQHKDPWGAHHLTGIFEC